MPARLLLLMLLFAAGCREFIVGPELKEVRPVLPGLEGSWHGSFVGNLAVLGDPVERDTFHIALTIRAAGVEYGFYGRVRRDSAQGLFLCDCNVRPVEVRFDGQARFACLQGHPPFERLVFNLDARLRDEPDPLLDGIVHDGLVDVPYSIALFNP